MTASTTTPATIVIVNDDPVALARLSGILEADGYLVLGYSAAGDMLARRTHSEKADLIITDLHMPNVDGWRLVRLLRSEEYGDLNDIPILVVSATFSGSDTEQITADIGADGFLEAPVDPVELRRRVQSLLGGGSGRRRPRVLIVDDSHSLLRLLESSFTAANYLVQTAGSLTAARESFVPRMFDVVIIDHHLPDGTGAELLDEFQAADPDCVFIAITTDSDPALALSLMQRGAAAYVRKPFEPSYLIEISRRTRRERSLLRVEELFERRTAELRESERQKSILLREVHHRMKNDMQLVQGTLMLQAERTADEEARGALDDAVGRVAVMARVYDALYAREDVDRVDAVDVVETLADGLRRSALNQGVTLDTDVADLRIRAKLSTSIGLIMNELVTNAAKHAFAGVENPRIRVSLEALPDGTLRLAVEDNGTGYEAGAESDSSSGFGMEMVNALAAQHYGSVKIESGFGTRVCVTLKH